MVTLNHIIISRFKPEANNRIDRTLDEKSLPAKYLAGKLFFGFFTLKVQTTLKPYGQMLFVIF